MTTDRIYAYIALGLLAILLAGVGTWEASAPTLTPRPTAAEAAPAAAATPERPAGAEKSPLYEGDHVVVFLDEMKVELRNGTTTIARMDILSKGKPGSYYETIGGAHENDYKIRNHFSSLGEVYLPYAVHVFGNFFIHGVPYYPGGKEVSSTYSGGCIRLLNDDAKRVYEFVIRGTPIVVTSNNEREWVPTATTTELTTSMDATRYMAIIVSLEVLKQDSDIRDADGSVTTRRTLIPKLLEDKDDSVIAVLASSIGSPNFTDYMNQKARALGLSNTAFEEIDRPVRTSSEDYARLMQYVSEYKSYLLGIASTTPLLSR